MNFLFYSTEISGNLISLKDQEALHCAQVLRKQIGDEIFVMDGDGNRYQCKINTISKKNVECSILEKTFKERTENIIIAIAPTKNRDRLEWMIEKLVEIGVKSIVLMSTKNTERTRTNIDRVNKKVISAVKQSLRYYVPPLTEMKYSEVLTLDADEKYIAHCYSNLPRANKGKSKAANKLILIGPEGDFTQGEIQQAFDLGFTGLDLGEYRLRTETAAIVATTLFQ